MSHNIFSLHKEGFAVYTHADIKFVKPGNAVYVV
jgi:hypothetical protein